MTSQEHVAELAQTALNQEGRRGFSPIAEGSHNYLLDSHHYRRHTPVVPTLTAVITDNSGVNEDAQDAKDRQGALEALQPFAVLCNSGQIPEYHNTVDTIPNWADDILAWHHGRHSNTYADRGLLLS